MKKLKRITKILCAILIATALVGNNFPAGAYALAEENSPNVWCGMNSGANLINIYLYADNFQDVSNIMFNISYDTESFKLRKYETGDMCSSAYISVNEDENGLTVGMIDTNGMASGDVTMMVFTFDYTFEDTAHALFEFEITECTDMYTNTIDVEYAGVMDYGYVTNDISNLYQHSITCDNSNSGVNEEVNVSVCFYENAGFYNCEYTMNYDADALEYKGYKLVNGVEGIVDVNMVEPGQLKVAFASTDIIELKERFLDITFITKENEVGYGNVNYGELVLVDEELREITYYDMWYCITIWINTEETSSSIISIKAPEEVNAYDTMEVELEMDDNTGFGAMTLEVNYDTDIFEFVSGEMVDGVFPNAFGNVGEGDGKITIAVAATSDVKENGTFAKLEFLVKNTATTSSDITLNMVELVDTDMQPVECTLGSAQIKVVGETDAFMYGDVDGNGKINVRDVVILKRWLADYEVEIVEKASDVDLNGKINVRDVVLIIRWLADYDVVLGK